MKPIDNRTPKVARVYYDLKDFRVRLAENSPVHYDICLDKLDPEHDRWAQTFKLYGTDRKGRLIVHERRWVHSGDQARIRRRMADVFVEKVVRPLNGVPGRLEVNH